MIRYRLALTLLSLLCPTSLLAGQLVVNEALVNEPGAQVSLEWFELWNPGPGDASLDDYTVLVNGNTITDLPVGKIVPAGKYLVVSRNLIAFESFWGNNSGLWGDDALRESYDIAQSSFQLLNSNGIIYMSSATDTSVLEWLSAGIDGITWERVELVNSLAQQSVFLGGTPGFLNSRSPAMFDWKLDTVRLWTYGNQFLRLRLDISNHGDSALPSTCVLITLSPDSTGDSLGILTGDSLVCPGIVSLTPGETVTIFEEFTISGAYVRFGALIRGADDRPGNNFQFLTAPGIDYPAVIINEFLADPKDPQIVEWVELKNISPNNFDLADWGLGDSKDVKLFGQSSIPILAGEYVVLTQNRVAFLTDYPVVSPLIVHEVPWSILNNNGDSVKLLDRYSYLSDEFGYASGWGDNITWSRSEESGMTDLWGRSAVVGGTPGDSNLTLLNPTGQALALEISPGVFSPDGDLVDDTAFIVIDATVGDGMQARVFDRDGRLVRTLFDGQPFGGRLAWDGMTDAGRRAPIGIYIVYVEINGGGSAKKTVVIAR